MFFFAHYQKVRRMYAIIDIETTGGNFRNGKITEIAIYIHDGKNIIKEFVSLINPEQIIPLHITQLTGITNEMVANAPKFYEIAKNIVEITEDCIFVAHNSSFDYGFIKEEFKSLGYVFNRDTLCTVKLSRKILPGFKSYSLGNICQEYGIENNARHRAAGDAYATVKLFEILLDKNNGPLLPLNGNSFLSAKDLHPTLDINQIKSLPEETGVYYFFNDKDDLIYIGKSNNIKKRVLSHLSSVKTQKAQRMKVDIARIDYYVTGSELIALLKESEDIKAQRPVYNKAQKKSKVNYGLYYFKDRKGYIRFNILKNDGKTTPLYSFESMAEAKDYMYIQIEKFRLCQKLCGLSDSSGSCFQYQIKLCNGACIGEEDYVTYNKRAQEFISNVTFFDNNMIIQDKGRSKNETSVVIINGGIYIGYGWLENNQSYNKEQILDMISVKKDTMDARLIIKRLLSVNKSLKVKRY